MHSEGKWICCPGGTTATLCLEQSCEAVWRFPPGQGLEGRMTTHGPGHSLDKTKPGTLPQLQFVRHSWKRHRGLPDGPGARSRLSCGRQRSSWTTIWGPRTAPRCLLKWLLACWPQPAFEVYLWFPLPGTFGLSYLGLQATIFTRFLLGSFVKTKQTQKKTARLQLFLQIHHDPDCSKQLAGKQGGAYSQGRLFFVQMLANIV